MTVPQHTLELHHAALACLQELPELRQQRREDRQDRCTVLQLVGQLAAAPEALSDLEIRAKIRAPPREPVEIGKLLDAAAACKSSARQTQYLTDRPDSHPRKPIENVLRPPQRCQREKCQTTDELRPLGDDKWRARAVPK
jgi:hypothetical protein